MLLPRPEMRIATRFGSRIVRRGPVLGRVPGPRLTGNGAAAGAFLDAADFECSLAAALEQARHLSRKLRSNHDGHADSAVKRPRHFLGGDVAAFLQERED